MADLLEPIEVVVLLGRGHAHRAVLPERNLPDQGRSRNGGISSVEGILGDRVQMKRQS